MPAELPGQLCLGTYMIEIGNMDELSCLAFNGSNYRRVVVTQTVDRDAGNKVEILLAVGVPHTRPFPPHQGDGETRVRMGHIFIGKFKDLLIVHALLPHHLGPDPLLGEYFQQAGMLDSAVNNVRLSYTALERFYTTLHLRDHPLPHDSFLDEFARLVNF